MRGGFAAVFVVHILGMAMGGPAGLVVAFGICLMVVIAVIVLSNSSDSNQE